MRERLAPAAIALLCVAALGLGAASLGGDLGGVGAGGLADQPDDGDAAEDDAGEEGVGAPASPADPPAASETESCVAGYDQVEISWLVAVLVLGVSLLVVVYTREPMLGVVALPVLLVPAVLGLAVVFAAFGCPMPAQESIDGAVGQNVTVDSFAETLGSGQEGEETSRSERLRFGAVLLGLVVGALLVGLYAFRAGADDTANEGDEQPPASDAAIAAAAGEAAAELESEANLDNGVYRAWAKMAGALDVDSPETSTPGEFADAALEAGLDADDVDELTALFEAVRYGTTRATPAQEQRAREALGRIEQAHSDGVGASDTGSDPGRR